MLFPSSQGERDRERERNKETRQGKERGWEGESGRGLRGMIFRVGERDFKTERQ